MTWARRIKGFWAATATATVSYHLIEAPFRFGFRVPVRCLAPTLTMPVAAVTVLVMAVPVHRSQLIEIPAGAGTNAAEAGPSPSASTEGRAALDGSGAAKPNVAVPTGEVEPLARILLIGDSVPWTMWPGLATWNENHPRRQVQVDGVMAMGCPLSEAGPIVFLGELTRPWPDCTHLREQAVLLMAAHDYDAIVVQMGHKDLGEREIDGAWRHAGDPVFDTWMAGQVAGFADMVASEGVPVLWASLTHARIVPSDQPTAQWGDFGDNDPARVDRLNRIVAAEIDRRPGFRVLDVAGWLQEAPGGEFASPYRVDGVHWSFDGSDAVAEWVVPQIFNAIHLAASPPATP